jgi:hypothetical protein
VCSIVELDTSTMPGGYTLDRLRGELGLRITAMPEFRQKPPDSQLNLDHPVWVEDKDFAVNRHLYRIGQPSPGGRRELAEICGHITALPLDRSRPMWGVGSWNAATSASSRTKRWSNLPGDLTNFDSSLLTRRRSRATRLGATAARWHRCQGEARKWDFTTPVLRARPDRA